MLGPALNILGYGLDILRFVGGRSREITTTPFDEVLMRVWGILLVIWMVWELFTFVCLQYKWYKFAENSLKLVRLSTEAYKNLVSTSISNIGEDVEVSLASLREAHEQFLDLSRKLEEIRDLYNSLAPLSSHECKDTIVQGLCDSILERDKYIDSEYRKKINRLLEVVNLEVTTALSKILKKSGEFGKSQVKEIFRESDVDLKESLVDIIQQSYERIQTFALVNGPQYDIERYREVSDILKSSGIDTGEITLIKWGNSVESASQILNCKVNVKCVDTESITHMLTF